MKNLQFLFIILPIVLCAQSQKTNDSLDSINNEKIKKAQSIDFISYNYKNLDKNFKITTSKDNFMSYANKYKFYKERIKTYDDSLAVVLTGEFDCFHHSRIAQLQITYTWDRISLYTWEKIEVIKKMAKKNNIKHPYYFKTALENDNLKNKELYNLLNNLKNKLTVIYGKKKVDSLQSNKVVLNFAFKHNPEVQKLKKNIFDKKKIEKFELKHGRSPNENELKKLGIECGKENCCQKN